MLTGDELVHLVNVISPLYVSIGLGYFAIKWNIISNDKFHPGLSGFTSKFSLPFLCFRLLATNNPYNMNTRLILADTAFKCATLLFGALTCFHRKAPDYVAWVSSIFNLTTMPNSVLIGIPLLTSLYPGTESYISTLIFLQIAVWCTVCIVILEIYKVLSEDSITCCADVLEIRDEHGVNPVNSEPNAHGVTDGGMGRKSQSTQAEMEHDGAVVVTVDELVHEQQQGKSSPSVMIAAHNPIHQQQEKDDRGDPLMVMALNPLHERVGGSMDSDRQKVPSSANSFNEGHWEVQTATMRGQALGSQCAPSAPRPECSHQLTIPNDVVNGRNLDHPAVGAELDAGRKIRKNAKNSKIHIAATVGKRVINEVVWSPVLSGTFLGLLYALFSFKLHKGKPLPDVLDRATSMLADCTLGLAMFMLGMSIGTSKKLFACGVPLALMGAFIRFVIAPAGMALCSLAMGLRGVIFRFSVMQAMVPQAVFSFVFATQYKVHADLFSTAIWFQTLIFLPFAIALNALLSINS